MASIKKVPEELVGFLKSQQYIGDSYIIAKELIENALDANSTRIKIQLGDQIVVEDDGDGIEDLDKICKRGFTSKEEMSYSVLQMGGRPLKKSHGFRGQALAAICELCDVEISTRCPLVDGNGPGRVKDYKTGCTQAYSREYGTTVRVSRIFSMCAIRRKLNDKNQRKNASRILQLLQAFSYLYNVHFTLLNRGKVLFARQGTANTRAQAIARHGEIFMEAEDNEFFFMLFPLCKDKLQIVALEQRVVLCPKITNVINTIFKKYFSYPPTFFLLLTGEADVNVSVDKTDIVLRNHKIVETKIKSEMELYFSQKSFIQGAPRQIQIGDAEGLIDLFQMSPIQSSYPGIISEEIHHTDLSASETPGISFCAASAIHQNDNDSFSQLEPTPLIEVTEIDKEASSLPNYDTQPAALSLFDQSYLIKSNDIQVIEPTPSPIQNISAYSFLKHEQLTHPSVIVDKEDFKEMKIIGQFNQGFILCILKKEERKFLITIDQHAADEIYNFEKLSKSFSLKKQKLVAPVKLDLTPLQELLIEDNEEVLEKNGFVIEKGLLHTIPVYKGYFFTIKDFYSLLENISNEIYESDKFREIMASKACRSSIMIGSPLNRKAMHSVVDNLSSLDYPWKCPHGRPTFKIITEI